MNSVENMLGASPAFKSISHDALRSTAPQWRLKHLPGDTTLWEMGDPAREMALVIKGELMAEVDGVEVGRIGAGEMVGEVTVFIQNAVRSATLKTVRYTEVLILSVSSLVKLWRKRSPVYSVLLDQALLTLARRVRTCDRQLAQLARGSGPAPSHEEPGFWSKVWKVFKPGGPTSSEPSIEHLLKGQRALKSAHSVHLQALKKAFEVVPMEAGQVIFLEGEAACCGYMVGEGEVDVLRHVRGNKAQLLAKLSVGDQFGINTLIDRGHRTASCVAATPGWLFKMDADAFEALGGEARLLWRENLLVSLVAQLKNANRILLTFKQAERGEGDGHVDVDESAFQDILKASGFLEGAERTQNLENIRVVFSEEQKRNPQNKVH